MVLNSVMFVDSTGRPVNALNGLKNVWLLELSRSLRVAHSEILRVRYDVYKRPLSTYDNATIVPTIDGAL